VLVHHVLGIARPDDIVGELAARVIEPLRPPRPEPMRPARGSRASGRRRKKAKRG
jgi:hypothetical protein